MGTYTQCINIRHTFHCLPILHRCLYQTCNINVSTWGYLYIWNSDDIMCFFYAVICVERATMSSEAKKTGMIITYNSWVNIRPSGMPYYVNHTGRWFGAVSKVSICCINLTCHSYFTKKKEILTNLRGIYTSIAGDPIYLSSYFRPSVCLAHTTSLEWIDFWTR